MHLIHLVLKTKPGSVLTEHVYLQHFALINGNVQTAKLIDFSPEK